MASPSTVLTQGIGSWGSVNLLPTLGFGIGAAIISQILTVVALDGYAAGPIASDNYSPGPIASDDG